jgi:polyphenol oxidase
VIQKMAMEYGTEPADLVAQLSPCIRPPFYEVDFAANIVQSLKRSGVRQVFDSGENTAADLERYYSYRMEKGRTGRMLALLAIGRHRSSVGLLV